MTHAGGVRHPSTSTFGVSAGAVSPVVVNASHTRAGFFIIDKHGWLAGAGSKNIWQSFSGKRKGDESPWQTASREMLEETGVPSEHLVSLAPPFYMRKDDHVYVLHIAVICSTHSDSTFPMVTSPELTRFQHFACFGDDAFCSEIGDGEIVHRRDIEPAFLKIAAEVYRAISMRAQAAATALPRPDSDSSSVAVPTSVSSTDDASKSDELLPRYPLLHESNYFNHEASRRKHARMLSNRAAREATWIDAVGQHEINKHFRDGDSERKRNKTTRMQAQSSTVRRTINLVGHKLSGMPDDPPPSVAAAAGPTLLVPEEGQRWSFEAKQDAPDSDDEREKPALQTEADAAYSAPAVVNREAVQLSPPSGTFTLSWIRAFTRNHAA